MRRIFFVVVLVLFLSLHSFAVKDVRLLRMPDINNNQIVFVYAGDIWSVSATGGEAKRLTSHIGLELFPKISPDGNWIAFSGEYSGSRQIYVIPSKGGVPKQLTYYNDVGIMPPRGGWDNIVLDWTPDSKKILFRSNRTPYGQRNGKYFLISKDGGYEEALQIPEGGLASFSPDGTSLVYAPVSREFRTWKRTKGGRAADVWTYNLKKNIVKRLTTFKGTDHIPFWYKNDIYFVSDRDLRLNIYKYVPNSKPVQITFFKDYDVMWPSGSNGLIAFEKGGYIYKLDLNTGKNQKVSVNINFDNPNLLPYYKNVKKFVYNATLNNGGKRVVFGARGDLFSVPAKKGITVNLTRTQGIRETAPVWSPDGKWIAYSSDKTGNNELYLLDPKCVKSSVKLTNDKIWKSSVTWSPDSKKVLYTMDRKLQLLDIKTKKIITVDRDKSGNINDYSWSSDSEWITYSKSNDNGLSSIWAYSVKKGKVLKVTNNKYNDDSPVFSSCGKYIFFVSDRDFDMNFAKGFSSMEFDFVMTNTSRMYAVALTKNAPNIFKEENDLDSLNKSDSDKSDKSKAKKKDKKKDKKLNKSLKIKFDLVGINDRISAFPIKNGRIYIIDIIGSKVLYYKSRGLRLFDLKTKKDNLVISGAGSGAISPDKKKLLYNAMGKWGIINIAPKQKVGTGLLNLNGLIMKIDPQKEWKQIFNEGWRLYRDFFYVYNMHGVDWKAIRVKYSKLLKNLSHRFDLDYIFGEMVGELNVGHTYVNWGDFKRVKRVDTGLLGADIVADYKVKKYKIKKIYIGENWNERTRSPLTEQGVNVNNNDYVLKINDVSVSTNTNFYKYLENTAGKRISITVSKTPDGKVSRKYWIKPLKTEIGLFYYNWVKTRRAMVDKLSNGKIAYIHVPDTAINGNREFFKGLYAYSTKKAYIIDDRYNGGGWDPAKMINKLADKTTSYWKSRNVSLRQAPAFAVNGPMVMLINHYSSSGGDNFPYLFRKLKLGKLIGTRTWGGLVGYGGSPSLVDGPSFAIPSSGIVGTDGQFAVEGVGIYPDKGFEVIDRADLVAKGHDPSLERAVKYLLKELKKKTFVRPNVPKDPNRAKWFEKDIK